LIPTEEIKLGQGYFGSVSQVWLLRAKQSKSSSPFSRQKAEMVPKEAGHDEALQLLHERGDADKWQLGRKVAAKRLIIKPKDDIKKQEDKQRQFNKEAAIMM